MQLDSQTIESGIRLFAEFEGATLNKRDDHSFDVIFSDDEPIVLIAILKAGMALTYTTYLNVMVSDITAVPGILRENWGGVKRTCFYMSVHFDGETPWLLLETQQLLTATESSPKRVAGLLSICRYYWIEAFNHINELMG